ncbi:hypothetical protein ACIA8G_21555 [Lentzea sp. NPDC051213]|uniref:hypothetical protein n=1 Tax=Lentzea sp. NPDC051213 TaxID=3364126 RepID=UPI00378EB9D6
MPHTTDKLHFAHCVDLLGGPQHLHAANRVNGRRVLDTVQPGQQCFQALLFGCFNSAHRQHPWDSPSGRSMHELHSYLGWISP